MVISVETTLSHPGRGIIKLEDTMWSPPTVGTASATTVGAGTEWDSTCVEPNTSKEETTGWTRQQH